MWLTRERDADIAHRSLRMLRVADAPAAIAARGFPAAVSLRVPLHITDGARPANSGRWQLTVAGGALRRAGLAAGGTAADDEALDAAFAATAYMLDAF